MESPTKIVQSFLKRAMKPIKLSMEQEINHCVNIDTLKKLAIKMEQMIRLDEKQIKEYEKLTNLLRKQSTKKQELITIQEHMIKALKEQLKSRGL